MPQIELIEPDGASLVWLDFYKFGPDVKRLELLFLRMTRAWRSIPDTGLDAKGQILRGLTLPARAVSRWQRLNRLMKQSVSDLAKGVNDGTTIIFGMAGNFFPGRGGDRFGHYGGGAGRR